MTEELPTVLLYSGVALIAIFILWQWHRGKRYENFTLVDLIAEEGHISSRKFMEFGSWIISSVAVVVMTIRGTITAEWLLIYTSVFVLGRAAGQAVHAYSETTTRKAEIMRGRRGDIFGDDSDTVEGEERLLRQERQRRRYDGR